MFLQTPLSFFDFEEIWSTALFYVEKLNLSIDSGLISDVTTALVEELSEEFVTICGITF